MPSGYTLCRQYLLTYAYAHRCTQKAFHWKSVSTNTHSHAPYTGHIHTHQPSPNPTHTSIQTTLLTANMLIKVPAWRWVGWHGPSSMSLALASTVQGMEKDPADFCWMNEWMNKAKGIEWAKGWQQRADGAEGFLGKGLAVGAIPSVFIPLGDPRGQGHSMGAHKCLSYKLYLCLRSIFRIGSTVCFQ